MPYEMQQSNIANLDQSTLSGSIDLLVFKVQWEVSNAGISITTTIDFGLIKDTKTAVLSFHNPSAEFSVSAIGFSAGLGIAFNDAKGDLELSAKACSPWGCEKSTTGIHILPAYAFGLITQGVAMPGINFLTAHFPNVGLQHNHLVEYSRLAGEVSHELGLERSALASFLTDNTFLEFNKGIAANVETWDSHSLAELKNLSSNDWMTVLATVVTDERLQEYYPGIDKKFDFPEEIRTRFVSRFEALADIVPTERPLAVGDRNKVLELIALICGSIVAIATLSTAACAVLAGALFAMVTLATASAGVIVAFMAIAALTLTVLAVTAAGVGIVAAIAALIFGIWWIFSDNSLGAMEPYAGFQEFAAA